MKYPKHIILDLKTTPTSNSTMSWEGEYIRLTNLTLSNTLSTLSLHTPKATNLTINSTNSFHSESYSTLTTTLFDIHFLRKEKLYTKLKYSRCPQYDIVSGGFAALLAGFVGFLISEKFGIELVDSADFYNALMYGVFGALSIRPLLRVYSQDNTPYSPLSPKYLLIFIRDILILIIYTLGSLWSRVLNFFKNN